VVWGDRGVKPGLGKKSFRQREQTTKSGYKKKPAEIRESILEFWGGNDLRRGSGPPNMEENFWDGGPYRRVQKKTPPSRGSTRFEKRVRQFNEAWGMLTQKKLPGGSPGA